MKFQGYYYTILAVVFLFAACVSTPSEQEDSPAAQEETNTTTTNDPCDAPQTVAELLACANSVGSVDSYVVSMGSDFNGTACLKAWNDDDTVLTIYYTDSTNLWRVGEWREVAGQYSGHWFTNFSAKAKGWTRTETINKFSLTTCSKYNYDTCHCNGVQLPPDTIIQYEDEVRIKQGLPFRFGIVGANAFGSGGPMQWHLMDTTKPVPFRLLRQEPWQ